MTQTKKNIKELKASLPRIREKVISVALMLVISLTMIGSVSYAWYTMSSAPEVGSIRTTISSNGSLEVALAGRYDAEGNLLAPADSAGGDSFAAKDQTTVNANLTWGNLINLSEYYGIESLVLRPATFSDDSPAFLTSMTYADDGRVDLVTNKFDFTAWAPTDDGEGGSFVVPDQRLFGVRAISSVIFQETDLEASLTEADSYFALSASAYEDIVNNKKYISDIHSIVQKYLDANVENAIGGGDQINISCSSYIASVYGMMKEYYEKVLQNYGQALVVLANAKNPPVPYTLETLMATSVEQLEAEGIDLDYSLPGFKHNYAEAKARLQCDECLADPECNPDTKSDNWHKEYTCLYCLKYRYDRNNTEVMWSDLESHINALIDINTVKIIDSAGEGWTVSDIQALAKTSGRSAVLDLVSDFDSMSVTPIIIGNGMLKDCEEMCGYNMYVDMKLDVKYIVTVGTIKGKLQTVWYGKDYTPLYRLDRATTASGGPVYTGKKEADTTYGMVIDLWVRTNAADSMLILDGMPETVTYEALRKIIPSGTAESKQAFLYTYYTGEVGDVGGLTVKETATIQMFQIPQDVNGDKTISSKEYSMTVNGEPVTITIYEGFFYDTTTHSLVYLRDDQGKLVQAKDKDNQPMTDENGDPVYTCLTDSHFFDSTTNIKVETYTYEVVTGFKSSNRIDDEYSQEAGLETSTTQGSGSCYIFYASPEKVEETLALLSHLKLAFCDANGKKLASARLAVEYVFADSGKYIVPIVLEPGRFSYEEEVGEGADVEKVEAFAITTLNQNEATLISVVVYLDGEEVDNTMVMDKGTIQGSLNLQFASTADLGSLGDSALSTQSIGVSASASYGSETGKHELTLEFDPENPSNNTVTLNALVTGTTASKVQAIFRRQVNASQGAAIAPVEFKTDMTASVTFTMPGVYVLRSLWVNGTEYMLPEGITITVQGFSVDSVSFCDAAGENLALTAENFATRDIDITFKKGEQVNAVSVRFLDDNGKPIDVTLSKTDNADKWSGTVHFRSSGHYTLTYVKVNGEFYEIPDNWKKDITTYLGLRAEVALQSTDPDVGLTFPFKGIQEFKIFAKLKTDTGEELKNLTGLTLYYGRRGSTSLDGALDSPLTWDAAGYYTGTFNVYGVGVYVFSQIRVGTSNVITAYDIAPQIAAQATEPPDFTLLEQPIHDNGSGAYVSDLLIMSDLTNSGSGTTRGGYYVIKLHNCAGAGPFTAVFVDANDNPHYVTVGDPDDKGNEPDGLVNTLTDGSGDVEIFFKIPTLNTTSGSNGDWYVQEIRVQGVYDKDGKYYGETDDPNIDVAAPFYGLSNAANKLTAFSVVEKVNAPVSGITLGTSLTDAEEFMTAQSLVTTDKDGIKQFITANVSIPNVTLSNLNLEITSVTITLTHKRSDTLQYGGYIYDSGSTGYETLTFAMAYTNGKWQVPESAKAYLAGTYSYSIKIVIDQINDAADGVDFPSQNFTISGGATNALTVWTKAPTVQMTEAGYASSASNAGASTINGSKVTVQFPKTVNEGLCGIGASTTYKHPYVTLKLQGYGGAASASITFTTNNTDQIVHMYTGENDPNTITDAFKWTTDGNCKRFVGYLNGSRDQPASAGKLTANTLVLTFGNAKFTVTLPATIEITSSNPD